LLIEEEIGDVIQEGELPDEKVIDKPAAAATEAASPTGEQPIEVGWNMFEKLSKIGEGANGTVYKVKALTNTVFLSEIEARIELNTPELMHKYARSK